MIQTLNPEQKSAVLHVDGPCVVTAVPGSGKTHALVARIIHLINAHQVNPQHILGLTFTNKAANEMLDRVKKHLKPNQSKVWISTFHRLCLSILRKYGYLIDLDANFSIYSEKDQIELIRKIARMHEIEDCKKYVLSYMAKAINDFREDVHEIDDHIGELSSVEVDVVKEYLTTLDEFNAVDFSGMLYKTWLLMKEHPKVASVLGNKFKYVLVDEAQDTNTVQYEIVKAIAHHSNLFLVGDYQQSIFSWRGARPENLNRIKNDFDDVKEIVLHRNYRSTQEILQAAQNLIRHNDNAKDVILNAVRGKGYIVSVKCCPDTHYESTFVVETINNIRYEHNYDWNDIAVLYRTNHQSKPIETKLRQYEMPYKIVGGFSFFDRAEIKTALAYLSFYCNPSNTIAFARAIKEPKRQVGDVAIGRLERFSQQQKMPINEVCHCLDKIDISKIACTKIGEFIDIFDNLKESNKGIVEIATEILVQTGYIDHLRQEQKKTNTSANKVENVEELLIAIGDYQESKKSAMLEGYLQTVQLERESEEKSNAVTLSTMHAAKGKEYKAVFIIGAEKDIIPHAMAVREGNIDEERRLMYVAMTRAKDLLSISHCLMRSHMTFSTQQKYSKASGPSPFLEEIV